MLRCIIRKRRFPGGIPGSSLRPFSQGGANSETPNVRFSWSTSRPISAAAPSFASWRNRRLRYHAAIQHRHLSSSPPSSNSQQQQLHDLAHFTDMVLDPLKSPLGTLSSMRMYNDILDAMQAWLDFGTNSDDNNSNTMVIPKHVDKVHQLLKRLLYEHHANNSRRRLNGGENDDSIRLLQPYLQVTFQCWLQIAQDFPHAYMAVQKAHVLFQALDMLPSDEYPANFVRLLQGHIRFGEQNPSTDNSIHSCQAAWNMLLDERCRSQVIPQIGQMQQSSSTTGNNEPSTMESDLQQAYSRMLHLILESIPENKGRTSMASALLQEMSELAQHQSGWETLYQEGPELDAIVDRLYLPTTSLESSIPSSATTDGSLPAVSLSDFERRALQRRILDRIDQATENDQDSVEEMIVYWKTNMLDKQDNSDRKALARVVTDYYLRTRDPIQATRWMQIQELKQPDIDDVPAAGAKERIPPQRTGLSDDADDTAKEQFEELQAVNDIFSANESERIRQKLNLLNIWATRVPRSSMQPYRATEILDSLQAESTSALDADTFTTVANLWYRNGKLEKAMEIAMRSSQFSVNWISMVLKLINEHMKSRPLDGTANGPYSATYTDLVTLLEKHMDEIPDDRLADVMDLASQVLPASATLPQLVQVVQNRKLPVPAKLSEKAILYLCNSPDSLDGALQLLNLLEQSSSPLSIQCYQYVLRCMLRRGSSESSSNIKEQVLPILQRAFAVECTNEQRNELAVAVLRCMSDKALALSMLDLFKEEETAMSLEYYKTFLRLCVRKDWADVAGDVLQCLKEKQSENLIPDTDIVGAYLLVLEHVEGIGSLDQRIELLKELIERYESSLASSEGTKSEQYRPTYEMFHSTIEGLFRRKKEIATEQTTSDVDPFEKDSRVMVGLLEKMHSFRIAPKDLSRSYCYNIAMEFVLDCQNAFMHFKIVIDLKKQMKDLGIKPNFFTIRHILRACALAKEGNPSRAYWALTEVVQALTDARTIGASAQPGIYNLCFRALLSNVPLVQGRRKAEAEQILASIFVCCCEDGCVSDFVRSSFLKMARTEMATRLYGKNLSNDGTEPQAWTRNLNMPSSSSPSSRFENTASASSVTTEQTAIAPKLQG